MNSFRDKIEKLVCATYMATSHIEDKEELKRELRKAGVRLLAVAAEVEDELSQASKVKTGSSAEQSIKDMKVTVNKMLSLIKVMSMYGLLAEKNAEVLSTSFTRLLSYMANYEPVPDMSLIDSLGYMEFSKRGQTITVAAPTAPLSGIASNRPTVDNSETAIVEKLPRAQTIINILRNATSEGYNMSDIMRYIDDASEKTIQREIINLVNSGKVLKSGAKRWSRYVLSPTLL